MIQGLNHITLSVRSLERSFQFYTAVLRLRPLMRNSKTAYLLAGDFWFCLEEDPQVRTSALPEYTHFAFSVSPSDFAEVAARIRESGAEIFKENRSEGDSLYFLDPDGHKLEIHVGDWQSRLTHYKLKSPPDFHFFE